MGTFSCITRPGAPGRARAHEHDTPVPSTRDSSTREYDNNMARTPAVCMRCALCITYAHARCPTPRAHACPVEALSALSALSLSALSLTNTAQVQRPPLFATRAVHLPSHLRPDAYQ
eukprot:scaffold102809_cov52-Phaeocystis_antarctica.AAC.1